MKSLQWGFVLLVGLASAPAVPADDFIDPAHLRAAGYYRYWDAELPLRAGDDVAAIYSLEDTLFVVTVGGDVIAVHRQAGLVRWARSISRPSHRVFRPGYADDGAGTGPVVFTKTGGLDVIDRYTGDVIKSSTGKFAPGSGAVGVITPISKKDRAGWVYLIFAGGSDGHLYAFEWRDPFQTQVIELWRVITGGPVRAAPVYVPDDRLYSASVGGKVYCSRGRRRQQLWSFDTGGAVIGEIVVRGDGVYVSNTDRSVYRLHAGSGVMKWRRRLPALLETGPVLMAGVVYQYCPGAGLYAIDAEYGDVLWTCPEGMQAITYHDGRVWTTTGTDHLLVVDVKSGDAVAEIAVPIGAMAAINPDDAAVILVTPDGRLFCARPLSEGPLTPAELEADHAGLNQPPRSSRPAVAVPAGGAGEE